VAGSNRPRETAPTAIVACRRMSRGIERRPRVALSHWKASHVIEPRRSGGEGNDQDNRQRGADQARTAGRGPSVDRILDRVSREVGDDGFSRYFQHQTRLRYTDGKLDVTVPTGFVAELISRKFGLSLVRAARAELDPSEAGR